MSESEYVWDLYWKPIGPYGIEYRFYPSAAGNYFDLKVPDGKGMYMNDCIILPETGVTTQYCRKKLFQRVYSWEMYLKRNGLLDVVR